MIGPYYRPQLTSVLSITHRATGVFLTVVATPLLIWWLAVVNSGPEQYELMTACFSGLLGTLLVAVCIFCLSFHFFNGIRHLVWDTGRGLDIETAYRSGWLVLALSIIVTAILLGALL